MSEFFSIHFLKFLCSCSLILFIPFFKILSSCFLLKRLPFPLITLSFLKILFIEPRVFFFSINYLIYLFWLCWVLVSVRGLSLVAASGGHSSSWCAGLSLSRPLLLRSTGSRRAGSVIVAHGPSCSAACGIFPDQGSNPCPLRWQADSQPLRHQGSPEPRVFYVGFSSFSFTCYHMPSEFSMPASFFFP